MSSEWQVVSLGDLTDWMSGGTPRKDEPKYWNGDIPWISANSMYGSRYSDSDLKLTQEGLNSGSRLAPSGSVLLLVRGGALHTRIPVGMAMRDVAFNQDVKALVPKTNQLRTWYLLYWLMGMDQYLLSSVVEYTGIGAGKLDTKRMQGLEFLLPPVSEQDAIVGVAKSLDDRITLLRESNTTLESIAQALFKSWFVDFDPVRAKIEGRVPEGMDEATAALFPDSFEESELGLVPMGWRVGTLGDVLKISYGKNLPTNKLLSDGYPVYGGNGQIGFFDRYIYETRQVLVACRGAASGKVNQSAPKSFVTNNSLVLESDHKTELPFGFLKFYMLNSDLTPFVTGSAQPQVTIDNLKVFRLMIPSAELLRSFESTSSTLEDKIAANLDQIQTLSSLRDTLLPRLISGQLSLSDS